MKFKFAVIAMLFGSGVYVVSVSAAESNPASAATPTELISASAMNEAGGRVLTLFTHPAMPNKMWAGTAHGGLWQSVDAGNSWRPASAAMTLLTVSTLAVDPGHADIMYAGTGEGRSNDVALRGVGMFRSADGGASWELLPLTRPATVGESWSHINSIAVSSAGVVLAATSDNKHNGFIYRSSDGGNTWGILPVYIGSKVGPRNMIYKVRFDPDNPNTAIFMDSFANVTHSVDGGISWAVVKKSSTCK